MAFTVDAAKPSSHAIADEIYPPSYLCIASFISKSVVVHLLNGSFFPSGAYLPPAIAHNMKISFSK
jgi:hypothetical protein